MQPNYAVKSQLIRTFLASLSAFLLIALIGYITYQISYASRSGGWASFGAGITAYFVVMLAYPLSSILLLRLFKVKNWLGIGILASVSLLVAYYVYSNQTISNLTTIELIGIFLIFSFLIFASQWFIFNIIQKSIFIKVTIGLIAAVMVVIVVSLLGKVQTNLVDKQMAEQTKKTIQNYSFQVYVPSYMPTSYHVYAAGNHDSYTTNVPSYYSVEYLVGTNELNDPPPIDINSFSKPASFSPPQDCGSDTPPDESGLSYPCQQIGISKFGNPIFYADNNLTSSNDTFFFTVINDTEVVISSTTKKLGTDLSPATAATIINSMQPKSYDELQKLYPQ